MASSPSPKLAFIILFLSTLLFSHQIHAIHKQFFSKVARNRDSSPSTINYHQASTLNNNNNKEEEEENEPTFLPETTQTGYGFYGHETGLNPPSLSSSSTYDHDDHMEKKNNYASELKGVDMYYANQGAPSTAGVEKQGISTGYYDGVQKQGMTTKNNYNYNYRQNQGAGYYGGVQKQGMSDTRFLENGKYFHDINSERNYDGNYKYIHYNGNNYNSNYENNYNNYEDFSNNNNGNPVRRYQNRERKQEEEAFDLDP